jgi:hypothetical protein
MCKSLVASFVFIIGSFGFVASADAAGKRYPPHGYPCLGCYPCPPSYCDNDNKRVIKFNSSGEPVSAKYRDAPARTKSLNSSKSN